MQARIDTGVLSATSTYARSREAAGAGAGTYLLVAQIPDEVVIGGRNCMTLVTM